MATVWLPVEVRFLSTAEGCRHSPANLADGRYRLQVILGRHETLPSAPASETEAETVGFFGVALRAGPSKVRPGESATAELRALVWQPGYDRLKEAQEFTLLEGWRIVGHGRVRE